MSKITLLTLKFIAILTLGLLAACGGESDSPAIASTDAVDATEAVIFEATPVVESVEVEAVVAQENDTVPNEELVVAVTSPPEPVPTTSTTTTTVAPTTTTSTTTVAPGPPTCSGQRYTITVPTGWNHGDCTLFTEGDLPAAGVEFQPEIDVFFATNETYANAIGRIESTETVWTSTPTTVDGLRARTMVMVDEVVQISETQFAASERTVVVVDAGDAVFFAAATRLVEPLSPPTELTLDARYEQNLAVLDTMLGSIDIVEGASVGCSAPPALSNAVVEIVGSADADGDGDLEALTLFHHDDGITIVIEGHNNGTIWGHVGSSRHVIPGLAWADWDGDGSIEIFYGDDGGAAGNAMGIATIDGCSIVNVDGPRLFARASARFAVSYGCTFGPNGNLAVFETVSTEFGNDGVITNDSTVYAYSAGQFVEQAPGSGTAEQTSNPAHCVDEFGTRVGAN